MLIANNLNPLVMGIANGTPDSFYAKNNIKAGLTTTQTQGYLL